MPPWLAKAKSYLGLREVPGRQHNATILKWWKLIRMGLTDDETPWCAGFVGGVLEECGIRSSRSAAARSYLKWGQELPGPREGAVVVFWRGDPKGWSGHVGFVVGKDAAGNLMVCGGNQGNAVSIAPFSNARVLGYRWPAGLEIPPKGLPVVASDGRLSEDEA